MAAGAATAAARVAAENRPSRADGTPAVPDATHGMATQTPTSPVGAVPMARLGVRAWSSHDAAGT